jgi:hypothetical protein
MGPRQGGSVKHWSFILQRQGVVMRSVWITLRVTCILALLLSILSLSGAVAQEPDAVPHVRNGSEPSGGTRTLKLSELWRAGGLDDEETVFGIITRVLLDAENNIYLLDAQLSEVQVYTPDGSLKTVLGREGDGPGEFRGPTDMSLLPDGTLGVMQAFPGKVVKLNLDNTDAGAWTLGDPKAGSFYIMRGLRVGGSNIVAGGTQQHINQAEGLVTRETFLSSLDQDGMRGVTYTSRSFEMKFQELRFDEVDLIDGADRRYDVAADGTVIVGIPRNKYEVSVFNADGTQRLVFSREYESWVRDARATDIWQRIMEGIQAQQPGNAPISWEETEPDIEFLRTAADGNIWVLSSRAMWAAPADVFTYYDVFNPAGEFIEQVNIVCEGDPRQDFLLFAGNERVFRITNFWDAVLSRFGGAGAAGDDDEEAEPMAVVCYEIN